jgi:hypothetical protein
VGVQCACALHFVPGGLPLAPGRLAGRIPCTAASAARRRAPT